MQVISIDHVQLAMPPGGEKEARNFYQGILGIAEVPKPPSLAKRGGCWFERDSLKVHLGIEVDFRPAQKAHTAFLVEDLEDLKARLETAGYSTTKDDALDGFYRIYVQDPFGNRIELIEQLPST
jgi:catechol 2,3-dioxygenase-like lactoylglutathione lyase family enzyme